MGTVFPGTLLKAAESYNMMNQLGYWTLESAFRSIATLDSLGHTLSISVNLSPTQLYDPRLMPTLNKLIEKYGVKPHLLEIELTEDVVLTNSLLVKRQLDEIKAMGISLSMDDFWKRIFKFCHLCVTWKLDAIKIDKAFIFGLSDSAVNSAIIKATKIICDAKGCETFVEGIESIQQLAMLKSMGINKGQGFLFSQAVPIDKFIEQLSVGSFKHIVKQHDNVTNLK